VSYLIAPSSKKPYSQFAQILAYFNAALLFCIEHDDVFILSILSNTVVQNVTLSGILAQQKTTKL